MTDLASTIAQIRQSWLAGNTANLPDAWRSLFSDRTPDDLDLVALTGQALQFNFSLQHSGALKFEAPIPPLAGKPLSEDQRILFRRAAQRLEKNARDADSLIWLAASRGYTMHPLDWMPASLSTPVPEVYLPWLSWMERMESRASGDEITAETWSEWSWTERRAAADALRRRDAQAGLALISAVAATEPAEKRLDLVQLLWRSLSEADVPFLESLATDRSDKVKSAVTRMLAHLRRDTKPGEHETELAGFLSLKSKGLMTKSKIIELNALKTDAQRRRRYELFNLVQFPALAAALGVSESEFIQAWNFRQADDAEYEFVSLVTRTGSSEAQSALLATQREKITLSPQAFSALIDSAPESSRLALLNRLLTETPVEFYMFEKLAVPYCGFAGIGAITKAADWKHARDSAAVAKGQDDGADAGLIVAALSLGIIASADAAGSVLAQLSNDAYPPTHPVFDVLNFNAALKGPTAP